MRHYDKDRPHEVTVKIYMKEEYWTTRQEAIDFYLEGALACEGAEANRYMDIVGQLMAGYDVADDGMRPYGES